jgi:hypothetical protein
LNHFGQGERRDQEEAGEHRHRQMGQHKPPISQGEQDASAALGKTGYGQGDERIPYEGGEFRQSAPHIKVHEVIGCGHVENGAHERICPARRQPVIHGDPRQQQRQESRHVDRRQRREANGIEGTGYPEGDRRIEIEGRAAQPFETFRQPARVEIALRHLRPELARPDVIIGHRMRMAGTQQKSGQEDERGHKHEQADITQPVSGHHSCPFRGIKHRSVMADNGKFNLHHTLAPQLR